MISVFLVDDCPLVLQTLTTILARTPDIEIVGTAENGRHALEKIPWVKPDVVLTDLKMPEMNGFDLVHELMHSYPVPILVVSAAISSDMDISQTEAFQVLEMGAMDILPKPRPDMEGNNLAWQQQLITKIKVLSGVMPITRRHMTKLSPPQQNLPKIDLPAGAGTGAKVQSRIVCLGASTGGPIALKEIFSNISKNFPCPICCAMHIYEGFSDELVDWLNSYSQLQVVTAQNSQEPRPGYIYFPGDNTHLTFDTNGRFVLIPTTPQDLHKPCVDLLFKTAAHAYGTKLTAAILTGMGKDGAAGLLEIKNAGGLTLAQDEASCVVYGMPKEAVSMGAALHVLPLTGIIGHLMEMGRHDFLPASPVN